MKNTVLSTAIRQCYWPLAVAMIFSCAVNILYLALPLYMSQVYDRVLSSRSIETLVILTIGAGFTFLISGVLEEIRTRLLVAMGVAFDGEVAPKVFAALFAYVPGVSAGARAQVLRDLDTFRQTMTGAGIGALFDLPWAPIFIITLYVIDPVVGIVTFIGALLLFVLAWLQDHFSRRALHRANEAAISSYAFTEASLRNAEVVRAFGMLPGLSGRWAKDRGVLIDRQASASTAAGLLGAAIKGLRLFLQILIIAVGALLILEGKIGAGVLYANMILSSKALAPIERLMGTWAALVTARQAFGRVSKLLETYTPPEEDATKLPAPTGELKVEGLNYVLPGHNLPFLKNLNFTIAAGQTVGLIGPSGAGKSTLVRLLIGIVPPATGAVRLDGANLYHWDRAEVGPYIGYLPQDVELFAGSARDNIARFRPDVSDEAVVEAAQMAGIHDLMLRLPKGYDTDLGEGGAVLSGGQRQRLGLARALLGKPKLLVLDEPNASLDSDGEAALQNALEIMKRAGSTVVIVSHRANIFRTVDKLLFLRDGQVELYGPRDEVLARIMRGTQQPQVTQAGE